MSQRRQRSTHVMGAAAGFHRYYAGRQLCGKCGHAITAHSPANDDCPVFVQPNRAAAVLAQVDAKDHYAHGPLLPLLNTDILHTGARGRGGPSIKGGVDAGGRRLAAAEQRKSILLPILAGTVAFALTPGNIADRAQPMLEVFGTDPSPDCRQGIRRGSVAWLAQ